MPRVYLPNPGFEEAIKPEIAPGLADGAEEAASLARAFAPVGEGNYRDSIKVVVTDDGRVFLVASDWKSVWIEYGTGVPGPTAIFAPLRRGIAGAGYRFGEDRLSGSEDPS